MNLLLGLAMMYLVAIRQGVAANSPPKKPQQVSCAEGLERLLEAATRRNEARQSDYLLSVGDPSSQFMYMNINDYH